MEDTKPEVKEEVKEEKLSLPKIDNPLYNFDGETGTFWIGLPLEKMDPLSASLMLDSVKMEIARIIGGIRLMAANKSQIVKPDGSAFQKTKAFINKFKK